MCRIIKVLLLGTAAVMSLSGTALAAEGIGRCNGEMVASVGEQHVMPYYGATAADSDSITHVGAAYACIPTWRHRFISQTGVATPNSSAHNIGQERWLTGRYDYTISSDLYGGDLVASGTASYRSLKRADSTQDDFLRTIGGVSYVTGFDPLPRVLRGKYLEYGIVRLSADYLHDSGLADHGSLDWIMVGGNLELWSRHDSRIRAAVHLVHNLRSAVPMTHQSTWYGKLDYTTPTWHNLSWKVGVSFSEHKEKDGFDWSHVQPLKRQQRSGPDVAPFTSISFVW